jgi:hypothetical protein
MVVKKPKPQHFYIDTNLGEGTATKQDAGEVWYISLPHQVFTFLGSLPEVRAEIVRRVKSHNENADSDQPIYSRIFGRGVPNRNAFKVGG